MLSAILDPARPDTGRAIGVLEYVFHRNDQPISKPTFTRQFAEARKEAGVLGKLYHDLRRAAARNMIRGGVPHSIAKRVTGHRSDSMFQRYDIASMDDKLEAIQRRAPTRRRERRSANPSFRPPQVQEVSDEASGIVLACALRSNAARTPLGKEGRCEKA